MNIDTDIIRQELQAGDEKTAQLYNALSVLRQNQVGQASRIAVLDAMLLTGNDFESRVQREQVWCSRTNDSIAVLEIAFDQALSVEEEARFAEQLLELTNNPGDFIGMTSDRGYVIGMASVHEHEAASLLNVAIGMASYAAPAKDFRTGYQCLTTAEPRPPMDLAPAPSRVRYAQVASVGGRSR